MFDWYTTMNQPDWDGRTYAHPLPPMRPPAQQNPMQRPQATNEVLPQGSLSGGLLGLMAEDKGFLGNVDPGALALFAGLSMLGNNTGGRTFGQLVGKAGFDALAGAGGMAAAQAAAERQKRQDAREDMATRIAQHKIDLERYKLAQESAGMQALQGYLGGGAGGGMMPSRRTLTR